MMQTTTLPPPPTPTGLDPLVQQHLGLVYASALRQVRDPHAAADVTQAVFLILQQKHQKLSADTVLPVWLLRVTRYACLDWAKRTRRRNHHEKRAAMMRGETQYADATESAPSSMRPSTASATPIASPSSRSISKASGNKTVARRLKITEAAAHKRAQRALGKTTRHSRTPRHPRLDHRHDSGLAELANPEVRAALVQAVLHGTAASAPPPSTQSQKEQPS
jgi:DNA-directed RNA polymerase specialized sigma24 family protein